MRRYEKLLACCGSCFLTVVFLLLGNLPNDPDAAHSSTRVKLSEAESRAIDELLAANRIDWDHRVNDTNGRLWGVAESWIDKRRIHGDHTPEMGSILTAMFSTRVVAADVGYRGTQLKLTLLLDGGQHVVFKPKWYDKSYIVEGKPYDGHDRHNAEIVAFHLNRLLGFNKVPLTVGRRINLAEEVLPVATDRLLKTFFNKDGNTCFYGKCLYCKSKEDGVCAEGDMLDGAVVLMLPKRLKYAKHRHPWSRTYIDGKPAKWEVDGKGYCAEVQRRPLYSSGPLLLDLLDACVFDYIIGNADRHHFEVLANVSDSMLVMFDNAKSFGNPFHDEESILAPLHQCQKIRARTVQRLRQLRGVVISHVLVQLLAWDPLAPLLTKHHYKAMERRLSHVLTVIDSYVNKTSASDVLVNDGYR